MDRAKHDKQKCQSIVENPSVMNVQTMINGNITTEGNLNTGNAKKIDNHSSKSGEETKWFQKEIVKMILSFIGGVLSTLVAQWLMKLFGWI